MGPNSMAQKLRLAVLIDGENISAEYAGTLFDEIAKLGDASLRQVYGNRNHLQGWAKVQAKHRIKSRKNGPLIGKKNPTDFTLIIDAITLLHRGGFDGFCIVSSDSDFSPLACYIRNSKKRVFGFGERKASKSLRDACGQYVELQKQT
jgi:NYN domain